MDMNESVTKDDLRQFGLVLVSNIRKIMEKEPAKPEEELHPDWLKSRRVRKMLDISPGTLQSLRITGKVRYKKVLGSYYYHKGDLHGLFGEEE
jgi:lipoate synthase